MDSDDDGDGKNNDDVKMATIKTTKVLVTMIATMMDILMVRAVETMMIVKMMVGSTWGLAVRA